MKHIIYIITALCILSGCSGFLDKMPITDPNNETYLSSESQVRSYVNGLYPALPSFAQYGMGVRSEDKNSDNILSNDYNKRLNGEYTIFDGDSDWSKGYENLRDANYFFQYYLVDEASETEELRSLRGEVHFFRAYWHFYLLKRFGGLPIMDGFWDGEATLEGLQQKTASDRSAVAGYIISDLETAAGLLFPRSTYNGLRINKEAALTLAMNVALYEGSWEKYHASDDFAAPENLSDKFFGKVVELGDELFTLMPASQGLNTQDNDPFGAPNPEDAFAHLFNQKDYSDVNEALFWKKYSVSDGVYHSVTSLLASGVTDSDSNTGAGVSKSLVDNYLNADGTFIDPEDEKFHDFNAMFTGRDLRLTETVMSSGHKFRSAEITRPMNVAEYIQKSDSQLTDEESAWNRRILPPYLAGSGNTRSTTGFHIALGTDTTYTNSSFWDTGLIIIRYAEALLAYAEAKEELGQVNDDVLDKTLKPLRARAGVSWTTPVADPNFPDFGYSISPMLQEIRRERRSELALQGFRMDDLMRWKGERLIVGERGRGAYFGTDGVLYKSFNQQNSENASTINSLTKDEEGWLDPLRGYLPNGYQFRADRDYLLPIPPDDVIMMNGNLKQNPNW